MRMCLNAYSLSPATDDVGVARTRSRRSSSARPWATWPFAPSRWESAPGQNTEPTTAPFWARRFSARVELDCAAVAVRAEHGGAGLLRLGPRRAEHEQRHARFALADEAQQIEQRRLGPVQVLEHKHRRTLLREQFEQAAQAPVQL